MSDLEQLIIQYCGETEILLLQDTFPRLLKYTTCENLRDIHLPGEVSAWPPAPGWWILAFVITILIIFVIRKVWQWHQQKHLLRISLSNLTQLTDEYERNNDPKELIKAYSSLLRRIALARFSRQNVAGLTGESWLKFLDDSAQTNIFNLKVGELLLNAPYQKQEVVARDIDELSVAVKLWVNRVNSPRKQLKNNSLLEDES